MYFHCFLLMPHLFSSLFREISCKSCPYPPSSLSSLTQARLLPLPEVALQRPPWQPCFHTQGSVLAARWSHPSSPACSADASYAVTLWIFVLFPGPVPPQSPSPASLLLKFRMVGSPGFLDSSLFNLHSFPGGSQSAS